MSEVLRVIGWVMPLKLYFISFGICMFVAIFMFFADRLYNKDHLTPKFDGVCYAIGCISILPWINLGILFIVAFVFIESVVEVIKYCRKNGLAFLTVNEKYELLKKNVYK